jgi:hypothetical protein
MYTQTIGCTAGFGNPDSKTWQPEADQLNAENAGAMITARGLADPKDVKFMLYARRRIL